MTHCDHPAWFTPVPTLWNRNTEALDQMAVGPVREPEGDTVEPHTEVTHGSTHSENAAAGQ